MVLDDGVGGADPESGSGLRGLEDRVASLGGRLLVDSPPGQGTRLEARIPLAPWRTKREPFMEFGHVGDDGEGLRAIAQVLAGTKRATVSLAREWDLEGGPPRIGQLLPVIDADGRRHATVEVMRVTVLSFGELGDDVIEATGHGASDLETWRVRHQEFYDGCRDEIALLLGEPGWRLTDEEPIVVTFFRPVDATARA
jgi:uncharacterized protein YhfF